MAKALRGLARRLLGVRRTPTYYLPWLTRPGLECRLLLNNVEARFKAGYAQGPFPVSACQYDADGTVVRRYEAVLADNLDTADLALSAGAGGCGFVTVDTRRIHSDLYVALADGESYTATHGRGEFVETYPAWTRAALAALGAVLALVGRTLPAFTRDQYVYDGPDSRSHLLLMNLSNVTNRIRIRASVGGRTVGDRLVRLPPMGARLIDVAGLGLPRGGATTVGRLGLAGNAWFNLYVVGAGARDLAGPLSLMHVK
jgi:hypothetical protein